LFTLRFMQNISVNPEATMECYHVVICPRDLTTEERCHPQRIDRAASAKSGGTVLTISQTV
jgi:hypothetical protein